MSESGASSSHLSCAVVEELLPAYAQDAIGGPARSLIERHVESCALCTERLAEFERGEGLGAVVASPAGTGWAGSRLDGASGRSRRSKRPPLRTAMLVGGLAGVGALGGAAVALRLTPHPSNATVATVESLPRIERVAPAVSTNRGGAVVAALLMVGDDESRQAGFRVLRPVRLRVQAIGEGTDGEMHDYAWIRDLRTHEPVWTMEYHATTHAGGAEKNRQIDHEMTLPPGDYALHYTTDGSHSAHSWNASPPHRPDRWGVALSTLNGRDSRLVRVVDPSAIGNVLVRLVGAQDGVHLRGEFTLDRTADVRLYALGEGGGGEMYDYGWLEDARTSRIVWQMEYERTEHAGGANKNRIVNGIVRLPAGRYVAHYVTDDSHSFGDWNSTPPRDQHNYGLTIMRTDR